MNANKNMFFFLSLLATLIMVLAPGAALAQESGNTGSTPDAAIIFLVLFISFICFYLYWSSALQVIAQKTGTQHTWLAWIPLLNILLMLRIAGRPAWWFIIFFIPIVGLVATIILWIGIAERVDKPGWWGAMVFVPFMNLIVPSYLAWAD